MASITNAAEISRHDEQVNFRDTPPYLNVWINEIFGKELPRDSAAYHLVTMALGKYVNVGKEQQFFQQNVIGLFTELGSWINTHENAKELLEHGSFVYYDAVGQGKTNDAMGKAQGDVAIAAHHQSLLTLAKQLGTFDAICGSVGGDEGCVLLIPKSVENGLPPNIETLLEKTMEQLLKTGGFTAYPEHILKKNWYPLELAKMKGTQVGDEKHRRAVDFLEFLISQAQQHHALPSSGQNIVEQLIQHGKQAWDIAQEDTRKTTTFTSLKLPSSIVDDYAKTIQLFPDRQMIAKYLAEVAAYHELYGRHRVLNTAQFMKIVENVLNAAQVSPGSIEAELLENNYRLDNQAWHIINLSDRETKQANTQSRPLGNDKLRDIAESVEKAVNNPSGSWKQKAVIGKIGGSFAMLAYGTNKAVEDLRRSIIENNAKNNKSTLTSTIYMITKDNAGNLDHWFQEKFNVHYAVETWQTLVEWYPLQAIAFLWERPTRRMVHALLFVDAVTSAFGSLIGNKEILKQTALSLQATETATGNKNRSGLSMQLQILGFLASQNDHDREFPQPPQRSSPS